MKVEVLCSNE